MSKWGGIDAKEFEQLRDKLSTLKAKQLDDFYRASAKELAARLLRKVSKRTPVGQYPHRTGGTLRRGWTIDADIKQMGNIYEITVFNPVEYASYVEFGHRTRNHKGWVQGKFMLTKSEIEIQNQSKGILERKLKKMIEEVFNGK